MNDEYGGKSKFIEDFSTRGRVIAQTEVSKEKSIAVLNTTKNASLGNMNTTITITLQNNYRSLSESDSDDE